MKREKIVPDQEDFDAIDKEMGEVTKDEVPGLRYRMAQIRKMLRIVENCSDDNEIYP